MNRLAILLAAAALTGCVTPPRPTQVAGWQEVATPSDRARLREWRSSFTRGLAEARAAGNGAAIDREGSLLQPDAALGGGIPSGAYRCRVIKLGARSAGLLPYIAYPAFTCRIAAAGKGQSFTKLTGSQRQVGNILPHDRLRAVFLGTLVLGDEANALPYGTDSERDLAGWVERIGDRRWRLLLPAPRFESLIDVVELTPL